MHGLHRWCELLTWLLLAASLPGQDDLRDRIELRNGTELRGRVLDPFARDEITLLQGGRRVRLTRDSIASTDLVGDRIRRFFEKRLALRDSPKAQEFLIDQAMQDELPKLARLQALWVVLHDDEHEKAHRFLGHEKSRRGWLWPHEGKKLLLPALEEAMAQKPMLLEGERFTLRCDAGLRTNVAALLDLERLGVAWLDRFGSELGLHEVLRPIAVDARASSQGFPKWGFRPIPYYVPAPHGDVARTFYAGPAPIRPERLFFVGTHGLLYRTLIGDSASRDERDRVCAWLEIGFGMLMEHSMNGPAGFAEPGAFQHEDLQALQALGRGYRLTHLLHLPMYASFYLQDDADSATNWAAATMFVAWLVDPANPAKTREPFLQFVREALGERKGDSSSRFDKVMGKPVEAFDEPWRKWLAKTAGY